MNKSDSFKLLGISTLLGLDLAACDKAPGPAEIRSRQSAIIRAVSPARIISCRF